MSKQVKKRPIKEAAIGMRLPVVVKEMAHELADAGGMTLTGWYEQHVRAEHAKLRAKQAKRREE